MVNLFYNLVELSYSSSKCKVTIEPNPDVMITYVNPNFITIDLKTISNIENLQLKFNQ